MIYNRIKTLLELAKFKITSFSALTAAVGYILATQEINLDIILLLVGTLLIAGGSAVLNQFQESKLDAKMNRTMRRPIPAGKVSPIVALAIAFVLILIGSLILFLGTNLITCLLGFLAICWYNGVYTYLKRITAFAVVPGALIGAIPPVMGWTAAGGYIFSAKILAVAFFFFIWQVPHFWLLVLLLGKDYERAGFPTLTSVFSDEQLKRITFVWIAATAVACVLIPLFGIVQFIAIIIGLFASAVWLIWQTGRMIIPTKKKFSFGFAFRKINIYALIVMVLVSLDNLI